MPPLKSFYKKNVIEAGCDEAGRGCLAGPVFAAAVILPPNFNHPLLNDSKQLSEKQRNQLKEEIITFAIAYSVAYIDNHEIDKLNIFRASMMAMHKAIKQLKPAPEFLIIDGNKFIAYPSIPHKCILKGDATYYSIAAASILAKTYRDDYMQQLHNEFPQYQWKENKGYPTEAHRLAIKQYGITKYHRLSFKLLNEQLELF